MPRLQGLASGVTSSVYGLSESFLPAKEGSSGRNFTYWPESDSSLLDVVMPEMIMASLQDSFKYDNMHHTDLGSKLPS